MHFCIVKKLTLYNIINNNLVNKELGRSVIEIPAYSGAQAFIDFVKICEDLFSSQV